VRIGALDRGPEDAAAMELPFTEQAARRRPLAPARLEARASAEGVRAAWLRRDAGDADGWIEGRDAAPPFGGAWRVEVRRGGAVLRSAETSETAFVYAAADRLADGAVAPFEIAVAEIAPGYGPGPETRIIIHD
jgi:hypothetical protein